MALTIRLAAQAGWIAAPFVVAGDYAAMAPGGAAMPVARLAIGYATMLVLLLVARRRALVELMVGGAAMLALVWGLRTAGDDPVALATGLAGAAAAIVPAALRDLTRLAGTRDRMALADLVRRRRDARPLAELRPLDRRR